MVMPGSIESSLGLPKPSGLENLNSAFVIGDAMLIVAALIARRADLALLATSGLAVGVFNGVRMFQFRWMGWIEESMKPISKFRTPYQNDD